MVRWHLKTRVAATVALGALGTLAAGCGSEDDYENNPRPAAPIVVTAAISQDSVSISPRAFGAGPINLIVTNQTDDTQQATLETTDTRQGPGISQRTGPINPSDTATLQVDIKTGTYEVGVADDAIKPARLVVGQDRPSAQNDLLQP